MDWIKRLSPNQIERMTAQLRSEQPTQVDPPVPAAAAPEPPLNNRPSDHPQRQPQIDVAAWADALGTGWTDDGLQQLARFVAANRLGDDPARAVREFQRLHPDPEPIVSSGGGHWRTTNRDDSAAAIEALLNGTDDGERLISVAMREYRGI